MSNKQRTKKYRYKTFKFQNQKNCTVRYGGDKYVILAVFLYTLVPFFIGIKCGEFETAFLPLLIFSLPALTGTLFVFRFCVKIDLSKRELQYRYFFEDFKAVKFSEIEKIYIKPDPKTAYLIIVTQKRKIKINLRSCENAGILKMILKYHMPKKFK